MKKSGRSGKFLGLVFGLGAAVAFAAAPQQAGPKLVLVDLSKASASFPVVMQAPEGAAATEDFGNVLVKKGDPFQVEMASSPKDLESIKKEIRSNPINKFKAFHVDTAEAILYESTVGGKSEFHFAANKKVGDVTYGAEDTKGPVYPKAAVELMLNCFNTLKAK